MVVVLPTRVVHYNTTTMDIKVGSTQDELQTNMHNNMTDVMKLLSQFPCRWYADNINMWQHLVTEKAKLREKAWISCGQRYAFSYHLLFNQI